MLMGKFINKYGNEIPPICPKATINGNPFLADSDFVISVENAQKRATTIEPKLSTKQYQIYPSS